MCEVCSEFAGSAPAIHWSIEDPSRVTVCVRYIDDLQTSLDFYTRHLGFSVLTSFGTAFADLVRSNNPIELFQPAAHD